MKKSYLQILQENLTSKSFKNKPPDPSIFILSNLDPYRQDIYQYFIDLEDLSKINSLRTFYAKLFKVVNICFYWCDENWQESVFVVYKHNNKFISIKTGLGSYETYHELPNSQCKLDKIFSSLIINDHINNINIHGKIPDNTHPELVFKFNIWLKEYKIEQQNTKLLNVQIQNTKVLNNQIQNTKILNVQIQNTKILNDKIQNTKILNNKISNNQITKVNIDKTYKSWAEIVSKKK